MLHTKDKQKQILEHLTKVKNISTVHDFFCVHTFKNILLENFQESETNELQNFLKKIRDANHQEKMERARWY